MLILRARRISQRTRAAHPKPTALELKDFWAVSRKP